MRLAPLFLCLLVCACASPSAVGCLKLKTYTPQEQNAQANAEEALPQDSPLVEPLLEWANLRNQTRACLGK
jgi:hypothetical protein